jgi:hypothetical protein
MDHPPPCVHLSCSNPFLVAACSAEEDSAARVHAHIHAERFRAHVAFLADDLLEGRDTGSRGHEIAARYVAPEFDSYG